MRVLISGGTGFIGRALCAELLNRGHIPLVWTRNVQAAQGVLPHGAMPITELTLASGVAAVINLAGENVMAKRWTATRKQQLRDSRIALTQQLVQWMASLQKPPRVLISGSAIGYYGDCGDTPVDESHGAATDYAARLCADWEQAAQQAAALGLRVCRVRIGVVLDAGGGALQQMLPPFRLGLGGPIGSGRQWMSWIHRADLVALLTDLVDNEQAVGAFNGTSPEPVRSAEFAAALGRALHRPSLIATPAAALKLLLGERASMLLGGQRVLPQRTLQLGFKYRLATVDAALASCLNAA